MSRPPLITVLCPTYNEKDHIENILQFFVASLPENKELFVIDGGSTDGTLDIIKKWTQKNKSIHLLHNPHKYVPHALNLALKSSTGEIIVRLDGHTTYSDNYFEKIIDTFEKTGADIVGGPMNPKGESIIQKAIAYSTSNWFGIGNSKFHDITFNGYVDSVYLGAWKRSVFNEVGYFDEQLFRNQDDEFHYRAKSKGKKIYLNSEIRSTYFPRSGYIALFKQYFQYGLYKPLVIKKVRSEIKWRHIIPVMFVLYLLSLFAAARFPLLLLPLILYIAINIYNGFVNEQPLFVKLACLLVYPIMHVSYGIGFLAGLFKSN